MSFDIIIAAMAEKYGINPEWGGCRPGILPGASQEYTFLVGNSPVGFSSKEVSDAVDEFRHQPVRDDAAAEFQAEPEPEPVVFTVAEPSQVDAVIVSESPKRKVGKK